MAVTSAAAVTAQARLDDNQSQRVFRTLLDALARPGSLVPLPPGLPTDLPPVLLPVLALADVDISVAVLSGGDAGWADVVRVATRAGSAEAADADMVVALPPPTAAEITQLRRGRTDTPEDGARLFVACAALHAVPAARTGTVQGTLRPAPGLEAASGADNAAVTNNASPVDVVAEAGARRVGAVASGVGGSDSANRASRAETAIVRVEGPGVADFRTFGVVGLDAAVLDAIDDANCGFPAGIDTWLVAADGQVVGLPRSCRLGIVDAHGRARADETGERGR